MLREAIAADIESAMVWTFDLASRRAEVHVLTPTVHHDSGPSGGHTSLVPGSHERHRSDQRCPSHVGPARGCQPGHLCDARGPITYAPRLTFRYHARSHRQFPAADLAQVCAPHMRVPGYPGPGSDREPLRARSLAPSAVSCDSGSPPPPSAGRCAASLASPFSRFSLLSSDQSGRAVQGHAGLIVVS